MHLVKMLLSLWKKKTKKKTGRISNFTIPVSDTTHDTGMSELRTALPSSSIKRASPTSFN